MLQLEMKLEELKNRMRSLYEPNKASLKELSESECDFPAFPVFSASPKGGFFLAKLSDGIAMLPYHEEKRYHDVQILQPDFFRFVNWEDAEKFEKRAKMLEEMAIELRAAAESQRIRVSLRKKREEKR